MNAIIASPYGLEPVQKDKDYVEAIAIENKILPQITVILNQYHNTHYTQRSWKIILGHWLRRYINVIINRTKTLEQCLQNYNVSGITTFNKNHYTLATTNSYDAIWSFNDSYWNNILTAHLLDFLDIKNISINFINVNHTEESFFFKQSTQPISLSLKKYAVSVYKKANKLSQRLFTKETDAFIINSYLPKEKELKLQLSFGQFPHTWQSSSFSTSTKVNSLLREQLAAQLNNNTQDKLEYIIRALLFQLIPICYLEAFQELDHLTRQQYWPNHPKFIFTSNNFDTDEIFKLWVAKKIEINIPYIVGQHGNNYGTHRYVNPSIEEVTSKKFLTWGWTDGLPQHIPTFILKKTKKIKNTYNPNGGLLLIELPLGHRITTWDNTSEYNEYFLDQIDFVKKLDSTIRENLTIRLHSGYKYQTWDDINRWKEFDQKLNVDTGNRKIDQLVSQSRIIVHSYDSTGILETLALNIPTLAFWQNDFEHLRESAKPYYQLLVDVGIIHFSPTSIAIKINEIWNNIDQWWMQSEIQHARRQFCDRYAKTSHNPEKTIKQILLSEINQ